MQPFGGLDFIYEIADFPQKMSARWGDRNYTRMTGEVDINRLPSSKPVRGPYVHDGGGR